MNKKIKTTLFVFIIIGVVILNFMYKNEETKIKKRKQNNLAIMIKDAKGVETNSNTIPIGNYKINEEKTHCENNGKVISYDNTTGKIGFSFIGSDRCYLFFEVVTDIEKPVISNLTINGKTISATLTDNEGLLAYGFSKSNLTEPTSWTTISGKTYNLNTTINTEGTYYLWVKDGAGNKAVSNVIDLEKKGWQTILANNGGKEVIESKGNPDFGVVATTNEGMYAMEDDLGTSYYFRGAVDNNWVKFGKYVSDVIVYKGYMESNYSNYVEHETQNECTTATSYNSLCTTYKKVSKGEDIYWRIIRINGDGSIRMIYSGTTAPSESTKVVMTGKSTQIFDSVYNNVSLNSEYVGFKYTLENQHGLGIDSTIKTKLDNWYKTTTLENDVSIKSLVADEIYCNDRNVTSGTWSSTPSDDMYYSAYSRLNTNKNPTLNCSTISDKFTVNSSGNGKLIYPVGLITMDELSIGGNVWNTENKASFLYSSGEYWTITPIMYSHFMGTYVGSGVLLSSGGLSNWNVSHNGLAGIRPVINLSSKVKLSGDGTYSNVYTVS